MTRSLFCLAAVAILARPGEAYQTDPGLPLNDLGQRSYQGQQGGLYPNGSNQPPAGHRADGLSISRQIQPLDANGQPDPRGIIGLLSIGMSNATQEFSRFISLAAVQSEIHDAVRLVDGAQGGQSAVNLADAASSYWSQTVPGRVTAAGLSIAQVQAVWLKTAIAHPSLPFPQHPKLLKGYLQDIVQILHAQFPQLKMVFLSSRTFAGYATVPLNPEPFAYQDGFAVKWLIEDQIQGKPKLNHDPSRGPVQAPFLAWGPYLWAEGSLPRSDGLEYVRGNFEADGTHPSTSGQAKVARLLLEFFRGNEFTRPWFIEPGSPDCDQAARVDTYGSGTEGVLGEPRVGTTARPEFDDSNLGLQVHLARPNSLGAFLIGLQPLAPGQVMFGSGSVLVNPRFVLLVDTGSTGHVEIRGFAAAGRPQLCGSTFYVQFVVDEQTVDGPITFSPGIEVTLGR